MILLLVSVVGGAGAGARFVVDGWARSRWASALALPTAAINVLGSLVIGVLVGGLASGTLPATAVTAAATGFCGGFTTFSTAMVEVVRLAQAGERGRAALVAAGTLVVSVAAAAVGVGLGSLLG